MKLSHYIQIAAVGIVLSGCEKENPNPLAGALVKSNKRAVASLLIKYPQ